MEFAATAPRITPVVSEGGLVVPRRTGAADGGAGAVSDAELIQRAGRGDRPALEVLYQRYARTIYGLALRRLGDRRGAGAPWLFAVARNAIVDRMRARPEPTADAVDEPSPEAGPDDRAELSWTQWRVHRALEELPEREREVIALAYWSGLSQSEVAKSLDIPLGTVKTRTRSALQRLASILEGELQ
jgi:RNA polymerase sigma-70 factor (ECF subfamily)